jgi:hypothetical protein
MAEAAYAPAQAEQQLGPDWTLQKADTPGVLDLPTWLAKNMPTGARVGVDPLLHTIDGARKLQVGYLLVCGPHCSSLLCCCCIGLLCWRTTMQAQAVTCSSGYDCTVRAVLAESTGGRRP